MGARRGSAHLGEPVALMGDGVEHRAGMDAVQGKVFGDLDARQAGLGEPAPQVVVLPAAEAVAVAAGGRQAATRTRAMASM